MSGLDTDERQQVLQDIAARTGRSVGAVRHWANGIREIPPKLCPDIEAATGHRVTRYEMLPEVFGEPTDAERVA